MEGYILETEAYMGESDLACHARAGRTARTEVMYGPAGRAYIYFIYGKHWMLNVVTGMEGDPQAVLLRAMWLVKGTEGEQAEGTGKGEWINGPGKLCRVMEIDGRYNGINLCRSEAASMGGLSQSDEIWIEDGLIVPEESIITGPRIGIDKAPEPWRSKPWRFRVDMNGMDAAQWRLNRPVGAGR